MRYVAIDPGASGGLVCLQDGKVLGACKMPDTEEGVLDWITDHCDPTSTVGIEQVGGYISKKSDGDFTAGSSAMFNFGWGYGGLRMAVLVVTGKLPILIRPQTWQAALRVRPRRYNKVGRKKHWVETKGQFKNRLKDLAQRLCPKMKVTLATADALLIAVYMMKRGISYDDSIPTTR